jgi:DNA-binding XRE family transcriptional regulator
VDVEILYVGDVPYVEWSLATYGSSPEPPRRIPVVRGVHRGPTGSTPEDLDPYPPDRVEDLFRKTLDDVVEEILTIVEEDEELEELILENLTATCPFEPAIDLEDFDVQLYLKLTEPPSTETLVREALEDTDRIHPGGEIRRSRLGLHITQVGLAKAAGVNPETVVKTENGDTWPPYVYCKRQDSVHWPTPETVRRLEQAFDYLWKLIPAWEFYEGLPLRKLGHKDAEPDEEIRESLYEDWSDGTSDAEIGEGDEWGYLANDPQRRVPKMPEDLRNEIDELRPVEVGWRDPEQAKPPREDETPVKTLREKTLLKDRPEMYAEWINDEEVKEC